MVAACEKQSILMFDPLNGKLVQYCNKAHQESVNCVRLEIKICMQWKITCN